MTAATNPANIELADDLRPEELRGMPFTMVCEVAAGEDGKPYLRARYPYRISKVSDGMFRLERGPPPPK